MFYISTLCNIPSQQGKRVLITAHGNSLRAIVKFLDKIPDKDIVELNIPTGKHIALFLEMDLKFVLFGSF